MLITMLSINFRLMFTIDGACLIVTSCGFTAVYCIKRRYTCMLPVRFFWTGGRGSIITFKYCYSCIIIYEHRLHVNTAARLKCFVRCCRFQLRLTLRTQRSLYSEGECVTDDVPRRRRSVQQKVPGGQELRTPGFGSWRHCDHFFPGQSHQSATSTLHRHRDQV